MKNILVIDESQLFRDYLKKKLEDYGFSVNVAVSGLDGSSKLRTELPQLLITDYNLTRKTALELLKEKNADPNTAPIPVIMLSAKVDRQALVEVAKYNVKKFLTKPIRVDSLLKAVSEVLDVPVEIDSTPCIIEAHVNDDILFIEVAQGLNREKIDLLRYKITELLDLYELHNPKVLVMMSSIDITSAESFKLAALLNTIVEATGSMKKYTKVLTNSEYVRDFVAARADYNGIEVTSSLDQAMDGLLGKKVGSSVLESRNDAREDVLGTSAPKKTRGEAINMRFQEEQGAGFELSALGDSVKISIVDDDIVIQELIKTAFSDTKISIETFDNGRSFLEHSEARNSDLVFLDLMMPEMNGFQVLEKLRQDDVKLPIIVLSALTERETVLEALRMGVSSYMIKPLKPQAIRTKATEILQMNF